MNGDISARRLRLSGAALFAITGVAVGLLVATLVPAGGALESHHRWFAAKTAIAVGVVALISAAAGWWSLSGRRYGAGARLLALAETMLVGVSAIAFVERYSWREPTLPFLLLGLVALALPIVWIGFSALRSAIAESRSGEVVTIAAYLARMNVCLHTTPMLRRRIVRETEDHLRAATANVGEEKAIERFGSPQQIADAFAAESRIASAYSVAWTAMVAVAGALAILVAGAGYTLVRTVDEVANGVAGSSDVLWDYRASWPRLESQSAMLSFVPPPLRGGAALALAIAALFALTLALIAVVTARRRPGLAAVCALAATSEGILGFALALVIERRLVRSQIAALPPYVELGRIAAGAALVAGLWWATELERRAIRLRSVAATLLLLVVPLLAGALWRAPQSPSEGYWGIPPQAWLNNGPQFIGQQLTSAPFAIGAGGGKVAFAWLGWPSRFDRGTEIKAPATIRSIVVADGRGDYGSAAITIPIHDSEKVRELAVQPLASGSLIACSSARGVWLKPLSRRPELVAIGRTGPIRLLDLRGQPSLVATIDNRLVLASAPSWQPRPLVGLTGVLLSAQATKDGLAILTKGEGGLRFELRTPAGSRLRSWRIPARDALGVVGLLPNGSPAIAFSRRAGDRATLWLGSLRRGKFITRQITDGVPCSSPIALGSVNGSVAVLTGSRCSVGVPTRMFAPDRIKTYEFLLEDGIWRRYVLPDWVYGKGLYLDGAPFAITHMSGRFRKEPGPIAVIGDERLARLNDHKTF